eukprot:7156593-Prymnesium_polylepis.1
MIASHAPPEVWVPRFRARAIDTPARVADRRRAHQPQIRADKAAVVCGSQQVVANAAADGVIHHLSRETHIRQSRSEQAVIGVSRFVLAGFPVLQDWQAAHVRTKVLERGAPPSEGLVAHGGELQNHLAD